MRMAKKGLVHTLIEAMRELRVIDSQCCFFTSLDKGCYCSIHHYQHPCILIEKILKQPGAVYVAQNLQFKQPVYVGDEIVGEVQATKIRDFKKNCLVKFSTRCLKKANDLVIDGEATAILPSLILQRQEA